MMMPPRRRPFFSLLIGGPELRIPKLRKQMPMHPHRLFCGDRYCPPAISPTCALCLLDESRERARLKSEGNTYMTTQPSFADLGVGEPIINVLTARGITTPFPIQTQTLPDTLAGRDVLGRGKTGSGKTLAFC